MTRTLVIVAALFLVIVCPHLTAESDQALDKAYLQIGTGDVQPMLSFLDSISKTNQGEFAELFEKYEKRFIERNEPFDHEDPFISQLYQYYADYWQKSLVDPEGESSSRKSLSTNLKGLLKENGRTFLFPSTQKIEAALIQISKKKGYKLLLGQTGPLRELMIWKTEEHVVYDVELPTEKFSAKVVFLQDFSCKGWYGFATFDVKHTGGWTSDDAIYRVGPRPAKENEWFRVSLLGHEGRHLLDKRRYGSIKSWILEYRAKLTELILAKETFHKLLNKFEGEARHNKSVPHAYASHQIIKNLKLELATISGADSPDSIIIQNVNTEPVKEAVQILLERSTKSLESKL